MAEPSDSNLPESQLEQNDDEADSRAAAELSEERLAESKQYGRLKLYCGMLDTLLSVAALAVFALVIAQPLDDWLARLPGLGFYWLRLAAFFTLLAATLFCLTFPLSYYSGFLLEHRFGLSRQSLGKWMWRLAKQSLLGFAFGLLLVQGLYFLIWLTGSYWWLAAAAGSFVLGVVLGQLIPILILPLFYKVERLDDQELTARFEKLAEGTGLSIEGIYRIKLSDETTKANAALTGFGRTRRVLLGDTLIEGFTADEIEVVLAHEVGHHVFRHIPKFIAFGFVFSTVSFFLCDRILSISLGPSFQYSDLPVSALAVLILSVTIFSTLLGPLKNWISRGFERQCDQYALDQTGLHAAFKSAFHKLAVQNKADPNPPALEVILFHDHPPISERLSMADQ